MSHGPEEIDYEKKGYKFTWFFVYLFLFIIMLIYIYGRNGDGLPGQ
jgi:hypothetical protein